MIQNVRCHPLIHWLIAVLVFVASVSLPTTSLAQEQTLCTLSGKVLGESNNAPIAGAVVIIDGVAEMSTLGFFRVSTSADGVYKAEVPVGIYEASVYAKGYETLQQRVGGGPDCQGADFSLPKGQMAKIPARNDGCINPSQNTIQRIVHDLNLDIGKVYGPSKRVGTIRQILHHDGDVRGRCSAVLILAGGGTEAGLIIQDEVNDVRSWHFSRFRN